MYVEIKNIELFSQFAQTFNKLCGDADLPMKTKLAVAELRKKLMDQAKVVEAKKSELEAKGKDNVTEEELLEFQKYMMETNNFPFNRLDVTMIAKNLSVIELEALEPITKGK